MTSKIKTTIAELKKQFCKIRPLNNAYKAHECKNFMCFFVIMPIVFEKKQLVFYFKRKGRIGHDKDNCTV